jgi:Restriction endonuclease
MSVPDWKKLEQLAAEIQTQLSPASKISHNVKIPGRQSHVDRQIDVLIEDRVGQFPIRIAIECKDHKTPVDVNVVGEFQSLMQDTGISKGVLVSPSGFTKAALQLASTYGIEAYRPVDTDPHKWRCEVWLPTICEFRSARIALRLSFSLPLPLKIPSDPTKVVLYDQEDRPMKSIGEMAAHRWDAGKYPINEGLHEVPLCEEHTARVQNGYGQIVPVKLTALIEVSLKRFYGQTPISKIKGFEDLQTGKVITNAFEFNLLDPDEMEKKWKEIGDSEPPTPATLIVHGLYCLGVSGT